MFRRKLKKLAHILLESDFDNYYKSWFNSHYKVMSKSKRKNLDELYHNLKEECYDNKIE